MADNKKISKIKVGSVTYDIKDPNQPAAIEFDSNYDASTNKAATVQTVTNKINALDGGTIGTPGAGKTVTALSQTNGNVSATFGNISITKSQVSDFPTSMPASDVSAWAKAANKPTYTYSEVGAAAASHSHNVVTSGTSTTSGGFMSQTDKKKLDGVAENATANVGTITGITMNGSSKGTSGVVNLGTVITAHQDISGKADKSATVSNVAYDTTNKKITKTINGTTTDVVSVATLKTDLGSMPASDVYDWAKAETKPTYTYSEVGAASSGHGHSVVTSGTSTTSGGFMSQADKKKLDGIAAGATANVGTITGIKMNGSSKGSSGVVDLGTVITAHQDISGKADKSATVSNVAYDSTNAKITKTINGTTSDVVTVSTLKSALGSMPASDVYAWAKASTKPSYSASEVGAIATTSKGANGGVAELDSTGKVPSSQLPSFVDDVLEYASSSSFPTTGESGKIYIAKDTNKTYRWSGTAYVEISPSLALGETSSTAYRGDRGKTAYDHSQSTHARTDATKTESSSTNGNIKINGTETTVYTHPGSGTNPHGTTKSDVGLGNVGNFKAVSTAASQGLTDTEKSNARANIGAGTSNLTIGTSATTAAAGNHTHDYSNTYAAKSHSHDASLATESSGTSEITLASNGKYKLTAGGDSVIFTMPTIPSVSYPVTSVAGKTGAVTLTSSDVGLSNVGNFKAVSTVASQGLTNTEKSNARANIGAGTSSLTIGTTASTAAAGNHNHDGVYLKTAPVTSVNNKTGAVSLTASDVGATDEKLALYTIMPSTKEYYPIFAQSSSTTDAAKRYCDYDGALKYWVWDYFDGSGNITSKVARLTLGNASNSRDGALYLAKNGFTAVISGGNITANRSADLPDKSGTIALTDDIPDVSGKIDTAGTGLSKSGTTLNHSNSVTAVTTAKLYPVKFDAQGHITGVGSEVTSLPASDVSSWAKASTKPSYTASEVGLGNVGNFKAVSTVANQGLTSTEQSNARANIGAGTSNLTIGTTGSTAAAGNHTHDYSSTYAAKSHTHGNIQNGGTLQTNDITIANGDKLVVTDSSDSAKVARTSISFDGSTTTKALTQKGTWETFGTSNLTIGTTASTAAAGNHNHDGVYLKTAPVTSVNTKTGAVSLTASDVGAATSGHTHSLSMATSTGNPSINLAANTKYQLTAGGSTYIFTTPADANDNYYHTSGSWSGLTYTATANGGAGALAFTIPTGSTSTTVAAGNHTHTFASLTSKPTTISGYGITDATPANHTHGYENNYKFVLSTSDALYTAIAGAGWVPDVIVT